MTVSKTYQVDSRALAVRLVAATSRHVGRIAARGKVPTPAQKRLINKLRAVNLTLQNPSR